MLNKLMTDEVYKGYIDDYTKIKDSFKAMLRDEGFVWYGAWSRVTTFGREGVWLNPISKLSIRVRWGIVSPRAILYVEKEVFDKIKPFLNKFEIVNGIASPNMDYDELNSKG